jgi:hypothetical protein
LERERVEFENVRGGVVTSQVDIVIVTPKRMEFVSVSFYHDPYLLFFNPFSFFSFCPVEEGRGLAGTQ